MKIAIIGAGAMGSVYAGLLADAGNDVWAIDLWEEHLEAIRSRGLRVEGASGDRVVRSLQVSANAADAPAGRTYFTVTVGLDERYSVRAECLEFTEDGLCAVDGSACGTWQRTDRRRSRGAFGFELTAGSGAERLGPRHLRRPFAISPRRVREASGCRLAARAPGRAGSSCPAAPRLRPCRG